MPYHLSRATKFTRTFKASHSLQNYYELLVISKKILSPQNISDFRIHYQEIDTKFPAKSLPNPSNELFSEFSAINSRTLKFHKSQSEKP